MTTKNNDYGYIINEQIDSNSGLRIVDYMLNGKRTRIYYNKDGSIKNTASLNY